MTTAGPQRRATPPPKFISGSILRHILNMTAAGALGLMAVFIGDLANMYFLSLAGDEAVVAAVGYASSILFFSTSIGIGLSIAASALVSPAIGANLRARARRLSAHAHVMAFAISSALSVVLWICIPSLLTALGAAGRTHALAADYLEILIPTLPFLAMGMASTAVLRSVGDARRAMYVTMGAAIVNVLLDMVLILKLGWGIEGAAISSAVARVAVTAIGLYGVVWVHDLMSRPKLATLVNDVRPFMKIAVPAMLTNIATPVGNAYVTAAMAPFGDGAVAGWAIVGRVTPVAFGAIYALSGIVGPIIGQNMGARLPDRMRGTLTQSLLVMTAFTATAWIILALTANGIASAFNATGEARDLIVFFCRWLSPLFVFLGAMFVANAAFNTLGQPHYSTLLNWGRATLGTIPFVLAGAHLAGAKGALAGNMAGGIIFGVLSVFLSYRLVDRIGGRISTTLP